MKKGWLLIFLNFTLHTASANFVIEGHLSLDEQWSPVVYLSEIPSFEDMHTVSQDMMLARAFVDSLGYFRFEGDFLPEPYRFYRLHVSKKADPPLTIIIGGKEENHFFFFANNSSSIVLNDSSKQDFLRNIEVQNSPINHQKAEIDQIKALYNEGNKIDYALGQKYLRVATDEKLRSYADTCSYSLVALYALYQTRLNTHIAQNPAFYHDFVEHRKDMQHSYLDPLRKRIPKYKLEKKTYVHDTFSLISILMIGIVLGYFLRDRLNVFRKKPERTKPLLSVQERRVLSLLKEGKTNKEISQHLHIELSTVKSHVHRIYAKKGIRSRKEILEVKD